MGRPFLVQQCRAGGQAASATESRRAGGRPGSVTYAMASRGERGRAGARGPRQDESALRQEGPELLQGNRRGRGRQAHRRRGLPAPPIPGRTSRTSRPSRSALPGGAEARRRRGRAGALACRLGHEGGPVRGSGGDGGTGSRLASGSAASTALASGSVPDASAASVPRRPMRRRPGVRGGPCGAPACALPSFPRTISGIAAASTDDAGAGAGISGAWGSATGAGKAGSGRETTSETAAATASRTDVSMTGAFGAAAGFRGRKGRDAPDGRDRVGGGLCDRRRGRQGRGWFLGCGLRRPRLDGRDRFRPDAGGGRLGGGGGDGRRRAGRPRGGLGWRCRRGWLGFAPGRGRALDARTCRGGRSRPPSRPASPPPRGRVGPGVLLRDVGVQEDGNAVRRPVERAAGSPPSNAR